MGSEDLFDNDYEDDGQDDLLGADNEFDRDDGDVGADRKPDSGPDLDDMDADEDMFGDLEDYDPYNMDDEPAEDEPTAKDDEPEAKADDSTGDEKPKIDDELAKVYADVLNVVGEDTILKVKGQEIRAGDLAPEELKMYLQKGIRSNDVFNEAKRLREEAMRERDQRLTNQKFESVTRQNAAGQNAPDKYAALPKELQPNDMDTQEVRALKEVIANLNDGYASIKQQTDQTQVAQTQAQLERELTQLSKEWEMGSVDEAIAVKYFRPEMELSDLMRETHEHYTSDKFLEKALQHNPTFLRQLKAEAVKEYKAKSQARDKRTAPTRAFRKASSDRVSTKPRVVAKNFDQAGDLAQAYIQQLQGSYDD